MEEFLRTVMFFFRDMFTYAMLAIFFENTIFSRAIGSSTSMFAVRKRYNIFTFGLVMTAIVTVSSVVVYFINPLVKNISNKYYVTPIIYVCVISVVYIMALILCTRFVKKRRDEVLSIIHISAFNCAVLGALLLASTVSDLSLGGFIGYGIGTGIGFTLATYFIGLAYERLSGDEIPIPFRGFPITLIYVGIVSLSVYGLIGHDLPF